MVDHPIGESVEQLGYRRAGITKAAEIVCDDEEPDGP
jgi:hypothetical protein